MFRFIVCRGVCPLPPLKMWECVRQRAYINAKQTNKQMRFALLVFFLLYALFPIVDLFVLLWPFHCVDHNIA